MKVIYIYDALCGWCYGFSPVIHKAWETYRDEMKFEVLSGGMMLGNRAGLMRDVAPYVKTAYKSVEEMTEIKFGEGFLNNILNGDERIDSLEPGIAMCIFKEQRPDEAVAFASALQRAINFDGLGPTKDETYVKLAGDFGMDAADFIKKLRSDEYLRKARAEFAMVQDWGVSGYPTVLAEKDGEYYLLSRGYVPYKKLEFAINAVKSYDKSQNPEAGQKQGQ